MPLMEEVIEETRQEQVEWLHRRLAALDQMEAKLREMRELAVYAASRNLKEHEVAQVQEWMNLLQAEVLALDKATAGQLGKDMV